MLPSIHIPWLAADVPVHPVILWATAIVMITYGPSWTARLEGLDVARVRRAELLLLPAALIGGRLHFILNNPNFFMRHPWNAYLPWGGAMHMGGMLLGILVAAPFAARRHGIPLGKLGDGLIPILGLSVVTMRLGCLLTGCCFGTPCDYAWCIAYPAGSFPFLVHKQEFMIPPDATASLHVHPAPVYFLLAGVFAMVVALGVHRHKRYDGQAVWVGMILLFGLTAALEAFRAPQNHRVFWGPLAQLTWTEIAMATVGVVGLTVAELRAHAGRGAGATPGGAVVGAQS